MIMLLDDAHQVIKIAHTEEQLFLYLQESWKNLDEPERENWQFARYSHKLLTLFVREMQEKSFVHMARQAGQLEQDLIVMCMGDGENPSLFLLTPGLDITALRRKRCKLYCKAHNMYIVTD